MLKIYFFFFSILYLTFLSGIVEAEQQTAPSFLQTNMLMLTNNRYKKIKVIIK